MVSEGGEKDKERERERERNNVSRKHNQDQSLLTRGREKGNNRVH